MKKILLQIAGTFIFLILFSFVVYPKPLEMVTFFSLSLAILSFIGCCINIIKQHESTYKYFKLLKNILQAIVFIYFLYFMKVGYVSLFEERLVLNVLNTTDGKHLLLIDFIIFAAFGLYFVGFYLVRKRWPDWE